MFSNTGFLPCLIIVVCMIWLFESRATARQEIFRANEQVQQATKLMREGKYLAALAAMERAAEEDDPIAKQELANFRSFVGDCAGAAEAMDRLGMPVDDGPELPDGLKPHPAVDAIVAQAKGRQIVILNEGHHVPLHREFSRQLMVRLHEAGFNYFAAETFNPNTRRLAELKYPIRSTGYYSHEPAFGQLIREAMQLGYTPVAYEALAVFGQHGDSNDLINARETDQAANLVKRIFTKAPAARVFIHVGPSHATENFRTLDDGREVAWMAARLGRETGIDPLTIDQTNQTERSKPELATANWREAKKRGWLDQPIVLVRPDESFYVGGHYSGAVDMQVFHPPARLVDGRPDWLWNSGLRQPVPIPAGIPEATNRLLVQAFLESENDDAIPVDQLLLLPNTDRPVLALPPGSYRIIVQDEAGDELSRESLNVPQTD